MRVESSLMSTDESKRTYKTSAIQRAIELVAKAKELVRELRPSARETKRSRRLSKTWRVASQKRNAVRDGKELNACSAIRIFIEDCAEPVLVIAKTPAM